MGQQEIELILSRHWSSYLDTPIFLVDPVGNLLYYNEPAEIILGRRFAETGEMTAEEWSTIFSITDEELRLLDPEELPLMGAEEYLEGEGIALVEWPSKGGAYIPQDHLEVRIDFTAESAEARRIELTARGARAASILAAFEEQR